MRRMAGKVTTQILRQSASILILVQAAMGCQTDDSDLEISPVITLDTVQRGHNLFNILWSHKSIFVTVKVRNKLI